MQMAGFCHLFPSSYCSARNWKTRLFIFFPFFLSSSDNFSHLYGPPVISKPVCLKFSPTGAESGLTNMKEAVPLCFRGWWNSKLMYLDRQSDFSISEVQAEDSKQDTQLHAYPQMQALGFHQLNSRKKNLGDFICILV